MNEKILGDVRNLTPSVSEKLCSINSNEGMDCADILRKYPETRGKDGNEILHRLTSQRNHKLRVDMQRFNGEMAFAVYSNFFVGDEDSKYQLSVQEYSGNAGDSLAHSNKMKFSTLDQDNDNVNTTGFCSVHWKSAGWFKRCIDANPNGQYSDSEKISWGNIIWYHWKNSEMALKSIQLMIHP